MKKTDNPESKPAAERWQGLSKVDWVTVWFFCWKVKRTESPGWAFYEYVISAKAVYRTLNVTDHKLWGKHEASRAADGHVILSSSHLDCGGNKKSRKPRNVGKAHIRYRRDRGQGEGKS